ncbi:hypothetical protein FKZ61_011380 [Litorilinea aerophila]|uniref:Uncharacterized protein n=1 Tax=Litorilinea aerophila TaxID=1204385 RepID=A0A540VG91_9CHLR|nr:hypothetical protein [Litorilinea aerophila]MCC9076710.1 hypothetical protein [Litorilinea aerophila]OUC07096.1 hypothetical protein RY27_16965 [Litorilinea aerophila]GIV77758.1 MAG: hypothetical protein KatS3mg050_2152 [Litorilinea sp.]
MRQHSTNGFWSQALLYASCYGAWLVTAGLALWLMLLLRINLLDLSMWLDVGPWVMGAVDKFGIVLLGLFWLIAAMAMEAYFRLGVSKGQLWPRVGRVLGVEVLLIALSYLLQWLYVG